jgi:hypothetical protein
MNRLTSVLALSVLAAASAVTDARATTVSIGNWSPLFQGIDETTATVSGVTAGVADSSQAYIVRIDLTAPGIAFTTTPLAAGGVTGTTYETNSQTTSQFLQSSGAQIAINANFFDPCGCTTTSSGPKWVEGLAVSNGTVVDPDSVVDVGGTNISGYQDLLLTRNNQASIVPTGTAKLNGVYNAVAGDALLVQHGVNVAPTASTSFNNDNPRSAAGLSRNGQYLYLVAIDGRQPGYSDGTSLVETADLLVDLDAWTALNLDGGGSTALVAESASGNPDVLNKPSNDAAHDQRYDGNNLGVFADPLSVPEPKTLTLFGSAVLGLMLVTRRRFSF